MKVLSLTVFGLSILFGSIAVYAEQPQNSPVKSIGRGSAIIGIGQYNVDYGPYYGWVSRTAKDGTLQWVTSLGSVGLSDIVETRDSNYIVVGYDYGEGGLITKVTPGGDIKWRSIIKNFVIDSIVQRPAGGFTIAGRDSETNDLTTGVINGRGELERRSSIEISTDTAYIVSKDNGNSIALVTTGTYNPEGRMAVLVEISDKGLLLKKRTFASLFATSFAVSKEGLGSIYLLGQIRSEPDGKDDYVLYSLSQDQTFSDQWVKNLGFEAEEITVGPKGNVVVGGQSSDEDKIKLIELREADASVRWTNEYQLLNKKDYSYISVRSLEKNEHGQLLVSTFEPSEKSYSSYVPGLVYLDKDGDVLERKVVGWEKFLRQFNAD